jgi:pyridoxal phosphate enzyme (YggS family)
MLTSFFQIKDLIARYEKKYHRTRRTVRLLAISKNQPAEKIATLFNAGQRCFGESYLQEALAKMAELVSACANYQHIEWHFIGPIQSNKTRKIAKHFTWVHSVTERKIAQRLSEQRPAYLPPLNICIQINLSRESTKSGIHPHEVLSLAEYCLTLPRLQLRGLMAMPIKTNSLLMQRAQLHPLFMMWQQLIAQGLPLDTLSMGMSNDLEAAIAEGATLVRIGTAIFGN